MTFAEAVAALMDSIDDHAAFTDSDAYGQICLGLSPVRRFFPTISHEAWEDLVDEAVVRFLEKCADGEIRREGNPAAYLLQITRNAAIDHVRKQGKEATGQALPDVTGGDDAIAASVDATAGRQAVEAGLRAAWEAGDDTVVQVVLAWLTAAAAEPGTAPSSRKVAQATGLSHTGVSDAMARFKRYLPSDAAHT